MAGRLQLAQTTFSFGQPDTHGILAEKGDGQEGCISPKIQPQELRAKLEETWGSGHLYNWVCGVDQRKIVAVSVTPQAKYTRTPVPGAFMPRHELWRRPEYRKSRDLHERVSNSQAGFDDQAIVHIFVDQKSASMRVSGSDDHRVIDAQLITISDRKADVVDIRG